MKHTNLNASGFFLASVTGGSADLLEETSVLQVTQSESILSPAAYTTATIQATSHTDQTRNLDEFKGRILTIKSANPNILDGSEVTNQQIVYRMEKRKPINNFVEQFQLLACDPSLLNNAQRRISNYYQCQTPTAVAASAFACMGVTNYISEESAPARDYQAANIHPFQVLAEQADVALYNGDPSFLHFATFLNGGTHYFRSVKAMAAASPVWTYTYSEHGAASLLGNPNNIMAYEFPCDFDLLADMMNGITPGGISASTIAINPLTATMSLVNGDLTACGGMGGALVNSVVTDTGSTDTCGTVPENYMSLRQARLSLIQPDKIAMKIVVPYNPFIHAGNMISVRLINKVNGELNYGSGEYLIVNLQNVLKSGGYAVTLMDLVSNSVGEGVV